MCWVMLRSKDVKALLEGRSSYRGDCPSCGGRMSFSASRTPSGEVAWLCFKASCKVKGRADVPRTLEEIVSQYTGEVQKQEALTWEMPSHFVSVGKRPKVMDWIEANRLTHAYRSGKINLMYDPAQDRLVFLIYDNGVLVDAVGRLLSSGKPKWYRYGSSSMGCWFTGEERLRSLVITEDILSACVASYNYSSVALLGTDLSDSNFLRAITYPQVYVCLDPDAYSKGVLMAARIMPYTQVKAVLTPDDLKYFTPDEVKEMLDAG